ncbi:hypothetical protein JRQ81_012157 [Phrynocephalus forsythii]|uniref:DDE-1 domain-containing protein n=1 Tax=Phrynocephalus forsythii TaxID=171643 RepID=A0A9Q0X8K2_9SAUR|nr:hypothetical protein JRQ81_012157 [Phrynocephalus forsythii]
MPGTRKPLYLTGSTSVSFPQAKRYLSKTGLPVRVRRWHTLLFLSRRGILKLPFRVLLMMGNVRKQPLDLSYEGVQIEFLPANTATLIQPLDQGILHAFKALYTQNCMQHLVEAMDAHGNVSAQECWCEFTIKTCLEVIQKVRQALKPETLNASWKKLWPECVHEYKGLSPDEIQHSAVDRSG